MHCNLPSFACSSGVFVGNSISSDVVVLLRGYYLLMMAVNATAEENVDEEDQILLFCFDLPCVILLHMLFDICM